MRSAMRRLSIVSGIATVALGFGMTTASAADAPDFTVDLPAGLACDGFDLRIEGWGGNSHTKEFRDAAGHLVRSITAGTGSALTFTNLSTGATLALKSNGATLHQSFDSDGTLTAKATGHTVLILFPTDVPAGPSTTLHVGQVVYTVDSAGVFAVQSVRGTSTDICAALTA